jgi:hypothetical protein
MITVRGSMTRRSGGGRVLIIYQNHMFLYHPIFIVQTVQLYILT